MEKNDRERRDRKYATGKGSREPAAFLRQIIEADSGPITPGRALDVATGTGRNALYLAARGFQVDAVDVSKAALEQARAEAAKRGLTVNFTQTDLAEATFPPAVYGLIVNFNFLDRSLVPKLKIALKPGGRIVFETFLIDQRALGHPKNPDYLLGHNELLRLFGDFRVLFYREGKFNDGGTDSFRAAILAEKLTAKRKGLSAKRGKKKP